MSEEETITIPRADYEELVRLAAIVKLSANPPRFLEIREVDYGNELEVLVHSDKLRVAHRVPRRNLHNSVIVIDLAEKFR
jgi:hypothetical protein